MNSSLLTDLNLRPDIKELKSPSSASSQIFEGGALMLTIEI